MENKPNAEQKKQIEQFANELAWKKPKLNILKAKYRDQYTAISNALQEHLLCSYARGKLILPNLKAFNNESVAAFSDYSGEGSGKYNTYSVLVCGWNLVGPFHNKMKEIRQKHSLGDKEISFKDFGMGQVARALPEYLVALNNLVPLLVTLAVDKRLATLFGPEPKASKSLLVETLEDTGLGSWKPNVAEKLVRIVHLVAFFVGLLTNDGQKIFWMTDHDEISPNEEQFKNSLALFQRVLGLYARDGYKFPIIGGAIPFAERSIEMLDLLSVTDVVAGSLEQYLTQKDLAGVEGIQVKPGADHVLRWLAHDGIGIKKLNILMRPGTEGMIQPTILELSLKEPPQNMAFIPINV